MTNAKVDRNNRTSATKSESETLADRAADAGDSMRRTLNDMKCTLKNALDVDSHVKRHPWIAIGTAAASGFIASDVAMPALRRYFANTLTNSAAPPQATDREQARPLSEMASLFSTVLPELVDILKTIILASLTAPIAPSDQPEVATPFPVESLRDAEANTAER
jgi:hypothetical protein